jgi:hypothetical protein
MDDNVLKEKKFVQVEYEIRNDEAVLNTSIEKLKNLRKFALIIPDLDKSRYQKELVSCCVNLLKQCADCLSYNKGGWDSTLSTEGVDIDLTGIIRELSGILQYIVNSSSWRDEVFHNFDKLELSIRLKGLVKGESKMNHGYILLDDNFSYISIGSNVKEDGTILHASYTGNDDKAIERAYVFNETQLEKVGKYAKEFNLKLYSIVKVIMLKDEIKTPNPFLEGVDL